MELWFLYSVNFLSYFQQDSSFRLLVKSPIYYIKELDEVKPQKVQLGYDELDFVKWMFIITMFKVLSFLKDLQHVPWK